MVVLFAFTLLFHRGIGVEALVASFLLPSVVVLSMATAAALIATLGGMPTGMTLIAHYRAFGRRNGPPSKPGIRIHSPRMYAVPTGSHLKLYRNIMEATSEGILITDLTGRILEVNEALCRITGYSHEQLVNADPSLLKSDHHEIGFYEQMWRTILETGHWEGEIWDRRAGGEMFPVWLSINTIYDDAGKPENYVGLLADISRVKEAEKRLNELAFYDSLTGLPNRSLFKDRFVQGLNRAQRSGSRSALLFIDLDHFKDINDTLGHLAGDLLLTEISKRIVSQIRSSDTVSRLGGDEFTVILSDLARSDVAAEIAGKIIKQVESPVTIKQTDVYISASIGIALFPFDGTDTETLIRKADAAMYEAKKAGRNRFRFASGDVGEASRVRIETESALRKALERFEFELYYQPQVSAGAAVPRSADGLVGAEALIRWHRQHSTFIGPDSFIDLAEDIGLIVPIGEWVLNTACAEAKRWQDEGMPLQVSVNVSARQFEPGNLPELVERALERNGLEPRLLKLEVTESSFMRDIERTVTTMRRIKEMGVAFAVDDFGVGFSSLQYLARLPIDYIKIDKSFIADIEDELNGGELVTAVISMARALGMSSIAEGVETEAQLEAIRRRGCDEIQGFLISEPIAPDEFLSFMRGSRPYGRESRQELSPHRDRS